MVRGSLRGDSGGIRFQGKSRGSQGLLRVSHGVSGVTRRSQGHLKGLQEFSGGSRRSLRRFKESQGRSSGYHDLNEFHEGYRGSLGVSGGFQRISGSLIRFQGGLGALQRVSGAFLGGLGGNCRSQECIGRFQGVPGDLRGFQRKTRVCAVVTFL